MKDTRVETANEGMCIIILSPQNKRPNRLHQPKGSKTKQQVSKSVLLCGLCHPEKIRQRGTGKCTNALKCKSVCETDSKLFLSARSDTTGKRIIKSSFFQTDSEIKANSQL